MHIVLNKKVGNKSEISEELVHIYRFLISKPI